jgi:centromere protein S
MDQGAGDGVGVGDGDGDGDGDMEEYGQLQQQLHSCRTRLHDRLQVATIATAERTAQTHGMEVSARVMSALTDLTFKSAERLAVDAELFAQHAGRKSVVVDDVLLVARRNDDVLASLRLVAQGFPKSKDKGPEKKRRKAVADAPDS